MAEKEGDEDEMKDAKVYKFHPFYGFVEKKDEDESMEAEEKDEQLYKFVPYVTSNLSFDAKKIINHFHGILVTTVSSQSMKKARQTWK